MALIVDDQQPNFKHFCKICKKGFFCGRALGGHMRAHGICDEAGHIDDDDDDDDKEPPGEWDDKNAPPSNKRMYALRTNPNRLKSCRVCENCGKEFSSWKSFLSHDGKCSSEDAESLVSSPGSDDEDGAPSREGCGGWSKRKRSLRTKVKNFSSTSEEEDLANCLMMLSNANVDHIDVEPEESCASASKEEERRQPMNFMTSMACRVPIDKAKGVAGKRLFECKACKKVFTSHQALGGHRASHKKVKGCFASRLDHVEDSVAEDDMITNEEFFSPKSTSTLHYEYGSNSTPIGSSSKRKSKVHECSICHRIFSSGQALGGHKRCHWITSSSQDASSLLKFHQFQDPLEQVQPRHDFINSADQSLDLKLDLNLPAPNNEDLAHQELGNPSGIQISTEIFLKSWVNTDGNEKGDDKNSHQENEKENKKNIKNDENSNFCSMTNADDEADSKLKLAKLSELKDVNGTGGSSPWLQVGIGSTSDMGSDP